MRMDMLPGMYLLKDYNELLDAVKPSLAAIDRPDNIQIMRHSLPKLYAYDNLGRRVPVRTDDGSNLVDDPTTGEKGKWPGAWFDLFNLIITANDWGVNKLAAFAAVHGWQDEHSLRAKRPPDLPNLWHKEIEFWCA